MIVHVFTDDDCAPCRAMRDLALKFGKQNGFDVQVHRIEDDPRVFGYWGVSGAPACVIEGDDGMKRGWFIGAQTETSFENKLRTFGVIE